MLELEGILKNVISIKVLWTMIFLGAAWLATSMFIFAKGVVVMDRRRIYSGLYQVAGAILFLAALLFFI